MNDKIRRNLESGQRCRQWVVDFAALIPGGSVSAFGQQDSAVGSRIAKNAEINDKMAQLIALKSTVGHMVTNFCSGNPGAVPAWRSAAHVEAAPKKKVPPTP